MANKRILASEEMVGYGHGTKADTLNRHAMVEHLEDGKHGDITTTKITNAGLTDLSGAAAGQIKFPATQNASADANTLDDYEEGTWTPVLAGSGGTSGQTYSSQTGNYTKIGRMVSLCFSIIITAKGTITDNLRITGLPFTAGSAAGLAIGYPYAWTLTAAHNLYGIITAGTAYIVLYESDQNNDGPALLTAGAVANNTELHGTITYLT